MVRYLSAAWFQQLREQTGQDSGAPTPVAGARGASDVGTALDPLVLRQVVTGAPDGDVTYDVVITGGAAAIDPTASGAADLIFKSDYATASAIAAGRLSTQAALSDGLLRVSGDVTVLSRRADEVSAADPLPAALRAETEL